MGVIPQNMNENGQLLMEILDIAFLVCDFLIGVTGNWEGTESKVGVSAVMCTTGEVLYLIG